ncbi:MAG: cysteine synthase A [Zetaproteobacteria bacterium CG12_big_fil_rev_8_21_14_0_65_54_13]|nr:MAG: cysteine synthase A [Zetaproteobacteria bacterium CG12_big_fil_rev_8_21_14_0_65_54_13]PIX55111.1 MAG: cysteine synthase A [Zetaproteobacteria bacterium CG_4_10_14_3_um_filter_54_28]PJA30171.1 MAG: cysteine synthase A [Zetaproteobacteria bacterium CG_4_9_14_3_um_filter_54_145]
MAIYNNVAETVGNTPLIRLNRIGADLGVELVAKCEFYNPLNSVKDRIGKAMIEAAEADGSLKEGGVIVEPTSGNTGIALAFVARAKGYRCILTMPESMSMERRKLLKLLGAELVLTPAEKGMKGAIARATEIVSEIDGAFMPQQFENPANPAIHRQTTAEEIWSDTDGQVDALVAGVGTGGTISGTAEVLKQRNPDFKAFAVEPSDSPVISGGNPGPHKIQGIGAGFIPKNLNVDILDGVIQVSNDEALTMARRLSDEEGIPGGISSGAAVAAALKVAARDDMKGKRIVIILPSMAERYMSTDLFKGIEV